jgi:hypothetical protein
MIERWGKGERKRRMDTDRPLKRRNIACRNMGTETLLYDAQAEAIHVLNPTALLIWNLCDGNHSLQDVKKELMAAFSLATEHDVLADIQQTVDTFAKNDLLVRG